MRKKIDWFSHNRYYSQVTDKTPSIKTNLYEQLGEGQNKENWYVPVIREETKKNIDTLIYRLTKLFKDFGRKKKAQKGEGKQETTELYCEGWQE